MAISSFGHMGTFPSVEVQSELGKSQSSASKTITLDFRPWGDTINRITLALQGVLLGDGDAVPGAR